MASGAGGLLLLSVLVLLVLAVSAVPRMCLYLHLSPFLQYPFSYKVLIAVYYTRIFMFISISTSQKFYKRFDRR